MNIVIYIIAAAFGLSLSILAVAFAQFGGLRLVYLISGLLTVAYIGALIFFFKPKTSKNVTLNALALASPPLIVFVMFWVSAIVETDVIPLFEHESPAFTAACKNAGAQFFNTPATPVRSIAYDSKHEQDYSRYKLGKYGRLGEMGGFDKRFPRFDEAVEFTEHRQKNYGLPPNSPGSYIRIFPKSNSRISATSMTADILVTYQLSPEDEFTKAPIHQGPVTHKLTVTDRRDGQTLATLRYVVDTKDRRICGPLIDDVLSEKAFLAKALGLE